MLDEGKIAQLKQLKTLYIDSCKICHGSGAPCICHDQYILCWKYLDANINQKYWGLNLENLQDKSILQVKTHVINYMNSLSDNLAKGEGLFLWGDGTGTGKTTLGCIVLKEAIKLKKRAYFITFTDCMALEKEGWKDTNKKELFDERLLLSDVLLIDELGAELKTSKSRELVEAMFTGWFRKRCDSLRSTIITTNMKKEDLEKEYGSRLFSTFAEHMQFLHFTSDLDYRQDSIAVQKPEVK